MSDDVPALRVEVVRSERRRKTVQAYLEGDLVRVHVPAAMRPDEEQRYVAELVERLDRRRRCDHVDLEGRARALAERYGLPQPRSVQWSSRQQRRWGSCTVGRGDLRLSTRLQACPPWVLDYVLVHELAHLAVEDHSAAFHELVSRYPLAERARGFLIAKGVSPQADLIGDDGTGDDGTGDDGTGDDGTGDDGAGDDGAGAHGVADDGATRERAANRGRGARRAAAPGDGA